MRQPLEGLGDPTCRGCMFPGRFPHKADHKRPDPFPDLACPNVPPCPHGALVHDVEDFEDTSPTCCVDPCTCGRKP